MRYVVLSFLSMLCLFPGYGQAMEIEGVHLADTIQLEGKTLQLNGAGIRSKFFFDIYVAGLYLEHPSASASAMISDHGSKRVTMSFLYSEVDKEKLIGGWHQGFARNQTREGMSLLHARLEQFSTFFEDGKRGDAIIFNFLSDGSTHVIIKGHEKGVIQGTGFQQALLAVWLGDHPADDDLKQAMLGK